jgi:alpha/beta hydrolase family protein
MQESEKENEKANRKGNENNLTRRGAMTVTGAAITAATIPATGVALAQATPEPPTVQETAPDNPGLTHKRVTTNGVNLHYVIIGSGPVVLCMHGWPQNHREFFPVIARLANRFTFIAPDLRGYADSDKPYDG